MYHCTSHIKKTLLHLKFKLQYIFHISEIYVCMSVMWKKGKDRLGHQVFVAFYVKYCRLEFIVHVSCLLGLLYKKFHNYHYLYENFWVKAKSKAVMVFYSRS